MEKKKDKVAVFDIDGTIFRSSLLVELHWKMVRRGIIPRSEIKKLDALYWSWVTRKGSYDDYIDEVVENFMVFIKNISVKDLELAIKQVIEVQSEIVYRYTRDLVTKLFDTHTLIAISGSPDLIVREFTKAWKFDYFLGTELEVKDDKFSGEVVRLHVEDKKAALLELCQEHGLSLEDSIGIGDTESDIGIFEAVASPICFNPTAGLYAIAKERGWPVVVERKNMIYELNKQNNYCG